ncbi:MAG TPA: universal stress protein [Methylomirabilota bacterium]|nr:universal stress protein [Methylomirabilota bacterium]
MNAWTVLLGLIVLAVLYVGGPVAMAAFAQWRRPWRLTCPRGGEIAQIRVGATRAAVAELFGRRVEIERCSRWPAMLGCRQECLAQPAGTWQRMRRGDPPPRPRATDSVKMIVVPLDGDRGSEAVLPAVRELAAASGATVRLLRVVRPVGEVRSEEEDRVVVYADQETQRVETEARDYLQRAAASLSGIPVEDAVRIGDVATAVVEEAEAAGADLIALAAHRRHWLGRLFGRSVATRLRRATTIPLLLVAYGKPAAA